MEAYIADATIEQDGTTHVVVEVGPYPVDVVVRKSRSSIKAIARGWWHPDYALAVEEQAVQAVNQAIKIGTIPLIK